MKHNVWIFAGIALALSVALAFFVAPYASGDPDGLDRVKEDHALPEADEAAWQSAPVPDYEMPGVENHHLKVGLAGLLGTVGTFGVFVGLGYLMRLLRRKPAAAS